MGSPTTSKLISRRTVKLPVTIPSEMDVVRAKQWRLSRHPLALWSASCDIPTRKRKDVHFSNSSFKVFPFPVRAVWGSMTLQSGRTDRSDNYRKEHISHCQQVKNGSIGLHTGEYALVPNGDLAEYTDVHQDSVWNSTLQGRPVEPHDAA